jgi:hypothetical protein
MGFFSSKWVNDLIDGDEYGQLAELSAILWSWQQLNHKGVVDNRLPIPAFVFVEALTWWAQASRSGAWTYFEATVSQRQKEMLAALRTHAPEGYAEWYAFGMEHWKSPEKMKPLDSWMESNDEAATDWLRKHVRQYREVILELAT